MRRIRYQEIADELRSMAVAESPGAVLPSESELSKRFGASRVTIRRALEIVRDEGLVASRQGFGWFVATEPVRQRLERLGTIESQIRTSGLDPERRVSEFGFVKPPPHVSAELGVDQVLRVTRINLADGSPFAIVTVWCPAELGQHLSMADVERHPFYELLPVDLRGASQTIGADVADDDTAVHLAIPAGAPVLKCRRVTTDRSGRPVLMSEHVFAAHRTEFVVDLPHDEPSVTPAGLRLVDSGEA